MSIYETFLAEMFGQTALLDSHQLERDCVNLQAKDISEFSLKDNSL